jgi:thiosulfate/3-mercaptopyruvate sulfurtransferase
MSWTTLISADELAGAIDRCVVVDCRHDLFKPDAGRAGYGLAHIPGAHFLHQDEDLAGTRSGRNGRHPLPDRDRLHATLAALGLDDDTQLVAYDDQGGAFAARLWWLARWIGHGTTAVLDGGLSAWVRAGYPVNQDRRAPRAGRLSARAAQAGNVTVDAMVEGLGRPGRLVIDARAPERYRGETEPLDPVAGHIPGSLNRPLGQNLRPDGTFKPAPVLRDEFARLIDGHAPREVVHSCGSGVSACHNLLAMEFAGLAGSQLYGGSWSEWVADPSRPVAVGPTP